MDWDLLNIHGLLVWTSAYVKDFYLWHSINILEFQTYDRAGDACMQDPPPVDPVTFIAWSGR